MVVAAVAIVLAGCVEAPRPIIPQPRLFESPLAAPMIVHKFYLPALLMSEGYGKGGALTYSGIDGCGDAQRLGVHWLYNWSSAPPICWMTSALPMVWDRTAPGPGRTCPVLAEGPLALLWNEPSWMTPPLTPDEAIELTHWIIEECDAGRHYASPAEISTDGVDGLQWMDAWWHGYVAKYQRAPLVEVMAHHCYSWQSASVCMYRLQAALLWAKAHGLRGVLVTEMAVLPCVIGQERALAENAALVDWLQQPKILGYALFATRIRGDEVWAFKPGLACSTALIDGTTGDLTAWGQWYAGQ